MLKKIYKFLESSFFEIVLIIILIFLNYFFKKINFKLEKTEKDRLIYFYSILVGIYTTTITLIGTTIISITKELLTKKTDKKIINFLLFVILETLFFIILLIKDDNVSEFYNLLIFVILVATLISFVKFIIILSFMFKANMNAMVKEIDNKDKYEDKIIATLENIEKKIK